MHPTSQPRRPGGALRARTAAALTGVLAVGSLAGPVAGATAAEPAAAPGGTFASSFESGDPAVDGTVESGAGLDLTVDDGPDTSYTAKENVGFTGLEALHYSGPGDAPSSTVAFDVDVPVGEQTELSYVLLPQFDEKELDYASSYVSVDLAFTDGTYLSDLGAKDDHGVGMDPRSQGDSATTFPLQWNHKSTVVGDVAAGKTIDRVLVSYDGLDDAGPVEGWIDDLTIADAEQRPADVRPSDWVDTRRGTNSNGDYSRGNNFPAAAWPNGFNFWTPMTDAGSFGTLYSYQEQNDAQNLPVLQAFSSSHQPSIWMNDRQTFQFMPSVATGVPEADRAERGLAFSHDDEQAKPYLYDVTFQNGLRTELAPTDHAAAFRFSFPADGGRSIILDNVNDDADYTVDAAAGTFSGWSDAKSVAFASVGMQRMYVYGEFSAPVTDAADIEGQRKSTSYVSFDADTVEMRVATSMIGVEQAKKNLELEIADDASFEDVEAGAQQAWDDRLGVVEVEGGSNDQMASLYGSMYRMNLYPNSGYENTGTADQPVYEHADQATADWGVAAGSTATETGARVLPGKMFVNTGFWDTFRSAWPSYALLWPEQGGQLVDGFVQQYRDGGWVSPWSSPGYARVMTGTSSDSAFADAYVKGVPGIDARDTYDAALKNATVRPTSGQIGRSGLEESNFLGYVPNDLGGAAFAWSKDGAMNDFAISQMATAMADDPATPDDQRQQLSEESEYLRSRSQEYVNLYDPSTGFLQGKSRAGEWTAPTDEYDPTEWGNHEDYAESDGWNEAFPATYDGEGLAALYGGRSGLADKLDEYFATPETGLNKGSYGSVIHEMRETRDLRLGQWAIPNQVSHHIPWMYAFTQEPWKGQEQVRAALQRGWIGSEIGQGYPGDEDNGATSAWYVMSALGLYPMQSATGDYVIGSPLFERATLHLPGGDVVIEAPGTDDNVYVQSLTVDGEDHSSTVINQDELADGATLKFTMGDEPGAWGTGADDVPGSVTPVGGTPLPMHDATGPDQGTPTAQGGDAAKLFDDTSATDATLTGTDASVGYRLNGGARSQVAFYTLTSGPGDAAQDPKAWVLEGSDDGETWTTLDERTDQTFPWRNQTRPFKLEQPAAMAQYRVRFTGLGANDTVSLAEVELLTRDARTGSPLTLEVGSATVRAGDSAQVPVTVSNSGDEDATVAVSVTAPQGWTADPATADVDVAAGDSATVQVQVTAADDAAPGTQQLAVTAAWGDWTTSRSGGLTVVGNVVEVLPGTPEEASWLVADDGSALTTDPARYTDEEASFVYRIPLAGSQAGTITVDIANQFEISASADRTTWTSVSKADGSPIFESNRGERTLDVADLLARTGSTDGSLYLRFSDSTPADGWGGKLYSTRLEISGSTGPTPSVDVTARSRCLAGTAYVAVRATNTGDEPVDVTLSTPYGEKSFTAVAPGKNAYQSFSVRASSVEAGTATVTATLPDGGASATQDVTIDQKDCA